MALRNKLKLRLVGKQSDSACGLIVQYHHFIKCWQAIGPDLFPANQNCSTVHELQGPGSALSCMIFGKPS